MYVDTYQTVVLEQTGWPGNIGDGCAETSRLEHLQAWLEQKQLELDLTRFQTATGFTRHPTAPEGWRETDFSSDQALPLYLAAKKTGLTQLADDLKKNIVDAGYKTGNGTFIHPGFYAILKDNKFLLNGAVLAQVLIFKFPYRWSDSKNWFEKADDNSGDYLNWIHSALYCKEWIRKLVPKEVLKEKVREYYKPEPNNTLVIDLYDKVLDKYW